MTVETTFGPVQVVVTTTGYIFRAGGHDGPPIIVNNVPLRFTAHLGESEPGAGDFAVGYTSAERNEWDSSKSYYANQASAAAVRKIRDELVPAVLDVLRNSEEVVTLRRDALREQRESDIRRAEREIAELRDQLAEKERLLVHLRGDAS